MLRRYNQLIVIGVLVLAVLGCKPELVSCAPPVLPTPIDVAAHPLEAPVQFPLRSYRVTGPFQMESWPTPEIFHGAEDINQPAGTPVYAMADGVISFSGPMGGYGWLVIIDHPQLRVYSLYGHLSPSHWARETGPVSKGDLIGELGHGYENGYNAEIGYIEPHLHFMIRVGQRSDYPRKGDRRWMAGWTKDCPENHGWIRPSLFILEYTRRGEVYLDEIDLLADRHTSAPRPALFSLSIGFLVLVSHGWCRACIRRKMITGDPPGPVRLSINPYEMAADYRQFLKE